MFGRPLEFNLRLYPMSRRYIASEVIRVAAGPVFLRLRMANVVPCFDPPFGSEVDEPMYANLNSLTLVDHAFAGVLDRSIATVSLTLYATAASGLALND